MSFSDLGRQVVALVTPTTTTTTTTTKPSTTKTSTTSSSKSQRHHVGGQQQLRPIDRVRHEQQQRQQQQHLRQLEYLHRKQHSVSSPSRRARQLMIDKDGVNLSSVNGSAINNAGGRASGNGRTTATATSSSSNATNATTTPTNTNTGNTLNQTRNHVANYHRGVRPRLDHLNCPVTAKPLMDIIIGSYHSRSVTSSCDDDDDDGWSASRLSGRNNNNSNNYNGNDDDDDDCTAAFYNLNQPTPPRETRQELILKQRQQQSSSNEKNSSQSRFAKLNTEIVQFQKMVAELEGLLTVSSSTPESMWRSRILLTSVQDSDRDLQLAIRDVMAIDDVVTTTTTTTTTNNNRTNGKGRSKQQVTKRQQQQQLQASRKKLQRDFDRVHQHLQSVLVNYQRKQSVELSLLSAHTDKRSSGTSSSNNNKDDGDDDNNNNNTIINEYGTNNHRPGWAFQQQQQSKLQEEKEEFFDRAMRERQEEVQRISQSMRKVQEIYTDLATLVDGQQEQIDKLGEHAEETKANTKAGLEQFQYRMWKMCGEQQEQDTKPGMVDPRMPTTPPTSCSTSSVRHYCKACHGAVGGILPSVDSSLDNPNYCSFMVKDPNHVDTMYESSKNDHNRHCYSDLHDMESEGQKHPCHNMSSTNNDDGTMFEWMRRLPPTFENLRSDVKESAHGAYQVGHALVEDLVEQVMWAARSNQTARRLTCTPMADDFSFDDANDRSMEDDDDFYRNGYRDEMKV